MNILFATAELKGLVSVGGLAEVAASLSHCLRKQGHDVRIAMPFYASLRDQQHLSDKLEAVWQGKIDDTDWPPAKMYSTTFHHKNEHIPLLLVRGHEWFEHANSRFTIYPDESMAQPYFFFAATVLAFLQYGNYNWQPDIIHCHDYHTGLITVYLHKKYNGEIHGQRVGTVFTIHNLSFQGICSRDILAESGLPASLGAYSAGMDSMEFYDKLNCMKGALVFSDMTSTVSETYAHEIQLPDHGHGLHGVLNLLSQEGRLHGIMNGIDTELWNPARLPKEYAYSMYDLSGKAKAKKQLQEMAGLEISSEPVIAIRSRWAYQKGLELLLMALRYYAFYEQAQFIIVSRHPGRVDPDYLGLWYELKGWAQDYPQRIAVLSNKHITSGLHYAGSDMVLMPSLFEPCGLTQLEAMCYGTVPIVRQTGGLRDTIGEDVGFSFHWDFKEPLDLSQKRIGAWEMIKTIANALSEFRQPDMWTCRVINALTQEHHWMKRVTEYERLYRLALKRIGRKMNSPISQESTISEGVLSQALV